MTPLLWELEYQALVVKEKSYIEASIEILRSLLISTLGLNVLRPTNQDGSIKDPLAYTEDDKNHFTPLAYMVANNAVQKMISEQHDRSKIENEVQSDANYEKLVSAIDDNDGDMTPILGDLEAKLAPSKSDYLDRSITVVEKLERDP